MSKPKEAIQTKRRLMFVKGEDYYFLFYNTFILLDVLGCTNGKKYFKDYRKLSYLLEFVADPRLIGILNLYKDNPGQINPFDKEFLSRAYSNGLVREKQLLRLLFSLEKKGIVFLKREAEHINVSLNKDAISVNFTDGELFSIEKTNTQNLSKKIKGLSWLNYETLLEKLFKKYNVKIWLA